MCRATWPSPRLPVAVEGLGELVVDIAYGGNFYAIVEPQKNFPGLEAVSIDWLLRWSPVLRRRVNEDVAVVHPDDPTIAGVSHVQWTGAPRDPKAHGRNAVFYGERAIDRSPCGTGTSARMAQLAAKGRLNSATSFVHESIIGTLFDGRVEGAARVGDYDAILPSIAGWARSHGAQHDLCRHTRPALRRLSAHLSKAAASRRVRVWSRR